MPVRSEVSILMLFASLHLVAQIAHGYSHNAANVDLTLSQLVFVVLVITILPWLAVVVAWKRNVTSGASLFALSMAASFLFGYIGHFVLDSPDLYSNVFGQYSGTFFHTALVLALLEFSGLIVGVLLTVYGISRSDRAYGP